MKETCLTLEIQFRLTFIRFRVIHSQRSLKTIRADICYILFIKKLIKKRKERITISSSYFRIWPPDRNNPFAEKYTLNRIKSWTRRTRSIRGVGRRSRRASKEIFPLHPPRFRGVPLFIPRKNDENDFRMVFRRQIQIPAALKHTYHPRQNRSGRDSSRNEPLLEPVPASSWIFHPLSRGTGMQLQRGNEANRRLLETRTPSIDRSFLIAIIAFSSFHHIVSRTVEIFV